MCLNDTPIEEMITNFLLNAILHRVGMSWIICSNKEMLYEIDKSNHPNWLNKVRWYNTSICSKLHGNVFEDFNGHARTDIYYLMCSIAAHDKKQSSYEYEKRSIRDIPIPKNATTESLEALGDR